MKYTCLFILYFMSSAIGFSQLKLENDQTPEFYVKNILLGDGVKVRRITHIGMIGGLGQFEADSAVLGVKSGLILTTGNTDSVKGPNSSDGYTSYGYMPASKKIQKLLKKGDKELNFLCKRKTVDISVLEFDFMPVKNKVEFNYIFGSEEYPEFVGKEFNDVFGFFLSGPGIKGKVNLATLPGKKTPITINTVNQKKNKKYFRKNHVQTKKNKALFQQVEFDGLTTVLKVQHDVIPFKLYHIKIAIGDVTDSHYDSGVFLQAGSFISFKDENGQYYNELVKAEELHWNIDSIWKQYTIVYDTIKVDNDTVEVIDFEVSNVFFDFNSSSVPDSMTNYLGLLADHLSKNKELKVSLYGYTDNVGSKKFNLSLSEKRAVAIKDFLILKGVAAERITYKGLGIAEENANDNSEEARAKKRRVEIVLE